MLFSQREVSTTAFETLFSVDSTSSAALKGRAIVKHVGNARERGTWTCSKCQGIASCSHVKPCKALLPEEFGDLLEHMHLAEDVTTVDINCLCEHSACVLSKNISWLLNWLSSRSRHHSLVSADHASKVGDVTFRSHIVSVSRPHSRGGPIYVSPSERFKLPVPSRR